MRKLYLDAIWVWVLFFVLAVVNGLLRDRVYMPAWGDMGGRIAGTLILIVAMLVVMYVFLRRRAQALSRTRLVGLGVLWVGLSLFFEFAVSHWVMEDAWDVVLAHYNVMDGRFHVLLRLVELAGPIVLGGRLLSRAQAAEDAGAPEASATPPAQGDEGA
jgi:hypothetical protein